MGSESGDTADLPRERAVETVRDRGAQKIGRELRDSGDSGGRLPAPVFVDGRRLYNLLLALNAILGSRAFQRIEKLPDLAGLRFADPRHRRDLLDRRAAERLNGIPPGLAQAADADDTHPRNHLDSVHL